ncbi:MAG: GspH/FimT family pseudopilin [Gammaproteobacteria bacterium]|nr:GspH/FimT family pseudopilin [Gammaproteobacteria bacterium]
MIASASPGDQASVGRPAAATVPRCWQRRASFFTTENGFTLIELVMVMVIIAVISVSIIARWPAATLKLDGQIRQLAADIRYTQSLAMTRQNMRYQIVFAAGNYALKDRVGTVIAQPSSGASQVTLPATMTLSAPYSQIVFDSSGIPYTTTTLPGTALASTATVTLTQGSETRQLTISPETGRVALQ